MRREFPIILAEVQENLLTHLVTGTIRWPKSLGRPHSLTLGEGFTIEYEYDMGPLYKPPGTDGKKVIKQVQLPEPVKWDLPEEAEEYAVGFSAFAPQSYVNHLTVRFARDVSWEYIPQIAGPGYLKVTPSDDYFVPAGKRVELNHYRVIHVKV